MPERPFFIKDSYVIPLSLLIITLGLIIFSMFVSGAFDKGRDNVLDRAVFLGTWKATPEPDETGYVNEYFNSYWGFVDDGSTLVLRVYNPGNKMLREMMPWSIEYENGEPVLKTYFWGNGPLSEDGAYSDEYRILNYDENSIVLQHVVGGAEGKRTILSRTGTAKDEAKKNFSISAQMHDRICKEIEDDSYMTSSDEQRIILPFSCDISIGNGVIGDFTFMPGGSVEVRINNKLVNTFDSDEGDYNGPFLKGSFLILQDVTYDDYADVMILESAGAYNFTYNYYAFDPGAGRFNDEELLSATNPSYDGVEKKITSFTKGRGLGDIYGLEVYQFRDGKYVLIKSVSQDLVDWDAAPGEGVYEKITEELKGNKMVEVSRKKFKEADLEKEEYGE